MSINKIFGVSEFISLSPFQKVIVTGVSIFSAVTIIGLPFAPFIYRGGVALCNQYNIRYKPASDHPKEDKLREEILADKSNNGKNGQDSLRFLSKEEVADVMDELEDDPDLNGDDLDAVRREFSQIQGRDRILLKNDFIILENDEIPPMAPLRNIQNLAFKTGPDSYTLYQRERGAEEITVELDSSDDVDEAIERLNRLAETSKRSLIQVEQSRENQLRDAGFVVAKRVSDDSPGYSWQSGTAVFHAEDQGDGNFYLTYVSPTGIIKGVRLNEDDDLKEVVEKLLAKD